MADKVKYMIYKDLWFKLSDEINLEIPIGNRDDIYLELVDIIKKMDSLNGLNYFFSCGTALGLVRDGQLLPWDNDVDIDVIGPTLKQVEALECIMLDSGYTKKRDLSNGLGKVQMVFAKEPHHCIDFCFWQEENGFYINDVPESIFFIRRHIKSLYKSVEFFELNGCKFLIPNPPEDYFTYLYGKDWKTPRVYRNWLKNAYDLKIDLNLFRVASKILWRINYSFKRRLRRLKY